MPQPDSTSISQRLRDRQRDAMLFSDHRAGAHSRRQIRQRQRQLFRVQWPVLAVTFAAAAVMCAVCHIFMPDVVAPYLIGAIVASSGWLIYVIMLEIGGLAPLQSGVLAEQWTALELRRLRRRGWRSINHVMLEYGDADHALLGPGGFFAVETKFRSNWGEASAYLGPMARSALDTARQLRVRIDAKARVVRPLVVLWGPGVSGRFKEPFEFDGVTFCPGTNFREFIDAQPDVVESEEVRTAYGSLSAYVHKRDGGEVATSGPIPRPLAHGINDILVALFCAMLLSLPILSLVGVGPQGLWAITAAVATVVVAVLLRRELPDNVRVRLSTTAVIATAAGLAALIAIVLMVDKLR